MAKEVKGYMFCREGMWYVRFGYHGHRYTHSLRTRKERDARLRMARRMTCVRAAILDGSFAQKFGVEDTPEVSLDDGMLISSAWQRYLSSVNRPDTGPTTLRQYQYQFERFLDWMQLQHPEVRAMNGVTKAIAREFAASITTKLSAGSFNKYIRLLTMVFRVLAEGAESTEDPWKGITRRRNSPNSKRPFSDDELKSIFSTAKGEVLTICLLGFHTALRLGDCCLLDWSEVDMATKMITRMPRKTARTSGKTVLVPMHEELYGHLMKMRPATATGYICPFFAAVYLKDVTRVTNRLQTFFRRCGIRLYREGTGEESGKRAVVEVGFHSFRHTWASIRAANGVDSASIRAIVGWGSPAMERIYTHVSVAQLERAINKGGSVTGAGRESAEKVVAEVDVAALDDDALDRLLWAAQAELRRRHPHGGNTPKSTVRLEEEPAPRDQKGIVDSLPERAAV